jgi:hypothetical protein
MEQKTPVLLVVLVETAQLRWFVAALGLEGPVIPLLRSEAGDLEKYLGLDFDEQVAFLRHRFCGVLQRGCDRIWARDCKACQFVLVFEGLVPDATGALTQAVADNLTQWMLNPPVAVLNVLAAPRRLDKLAGDLAATREELLLAHLDELLAACENLAAWELSRKKGS